VTKAVEEVIGHGIVEPEGDFPFTPRAKKVLELALREALEMGHSYISSSHILLALLREGEGVAAQVLRRLGLTLDQLRNVVVAAIEESTGVQIARHNTAPVDQGSAEPKAQVFIEPGVSTDQLRLELIRRICSDQVSAERLVQMLQILDE
ncbi:NDP-hexose 4-ketoreductase, partial [Candidatus Saccharibacteria bacterium]